MSGTETNDNMSNYEVIETKPTKKRYKPRDPNYNTDYYHKNVAPVECNIWGCIVVHRALYTHKRLLTVN